MAKLPDDAFFEYLKETAPPWLQGFFGERYTGVLFAGTHHLGLEGDKQAITHRFFRDPNGPRGVLPLIGVERMLERGPSETDLQYRERLLDAWNAWSWAGTRKSILDQLAILGFDAEIKEVERPGFTDPEYWWNWDGNTAAWARFWVILRGHPFIRSNTWFWNQPGLTWDDGHVWDGIDDGNDGLNTVRRIIRRFKPAHMFCAGIIAVFDLSTWDAETPPDGTWDNPVNRSTAASYVRG